ncbi:MAG: AlpA family phage regulatory protein [Pseudacidovorax sp.]|nr:AlpA family phage regulatory protein [Pseudacidovorax sp.]
MSNKPENISSSPDAGPAFYRLADVIRITALSRSTIYRRIAAGEFPAQVSLGGRATGWRREALKTWLNDPTGFRALATCERRHGTSGAQVRHVAAADQAFRPG